MLTLLADRWISRNAAPDPAALAEAAQRTSAIVITGGGSGIGLALARLLASGRQTLVLVGRTEARLQSAAHDINRATGARVLPLTLDIAKPDSAHVLMRWLDLEGLTCDMLVNSAGEGLAGPFMAQSPDDLETLVATNVAGLTRLTRAVLPGMLARGRGGVLTIGSLGGAAPGPWQAAYYASKAYATSLSEALAHEISGRGVRMTIVLPGPVETRFHADMGAETALYRKIVFASSADRVARLALRGYRLGRRVVAPGVAPTLTAYALRILPHTLTIPLIGWLLRVRGPGHGRT